ncbi:alpha/beta fold hydrolase [Ruegeria hyattellae]|uniref:alpha/beta fold hydrolase n=1 Tax=Ruegeria hyattellae TaxID=3233337 RepID=UPI00355BA287
MRFKFGTCILDDERFELSRDGQIVSVEPQVFDVLSHLLRNRDRVVTRDELIDTVWNGRFVSDAALSSRIRDVRAAVGDTGKAQSIVKTVHGRGFRFIYPVSPLEADALPASVADKPVYDAIRQDVRYFKSFDGIQIAYSELGDPNSDTILLKTANWMSHLEYDLESPVWRHWIEALSQGVRLIRYDERGNGMSDRNVSSVSYEDCVRDLECLVDHLALDKFSLLGISQGASAAADFATRQPTKVDKIIIYGGFVQGWRFNKNEKAIGQRIAMSMLMRTGWGQPNSEFRQLFTSRFMPEATPEQAEWFNELQRKSVSPKMAGNLHDMFGAIDVSHLLENVKSPTLVLHARDDAEIPIQNGRAFATGISDARFVSLDSKNHILLQHEPAFHKLVEHCQSFLRE